jgi:hypothetical protein
LLLPSSSSSLAVHNENIFLSFFFEHEEFASNKKSWEEDSHSWRTVAACCQMRKKGETKWAFLLTKLHYTLGHFTIRHLFQSLYWSNSSIIVWCLAILFWCLSSAFVRNENDCYTFRRWITSICNFMTFSSPRLKLLQANFSFHTIIIEYHEK